MFFLIDKPLGMTSYDVIRKLKKILGTKKIGHIGTLDPLATGCLLVASDNSTKLIYLLEGGKKRYHFTVQLDGRSESLDMGTEIIPISTTNIRKNISESDIIQFLLNQKKQVPPKYSALHIQGKRAYTLVKKGVEFSLSERSIEISDVMIIENKETSITLELTISSGGYIRSLAPIIGNFFGVEGGYISFLRRTSIFLPGNSTLDESIAQDLNETITPISISNIFHTFPTYKMDDEEYKKISSGLPIVQKESIEASGIAGDLLFCSFENEISLCRSNGKVVEVIKNKVQ